MIRPSSGIGNNFLKNSELRLSQVEALIKRLFPFTPRKFDEKDNFVYVWEYLPSVTAGNRTGVGDTAKGKANFRKKKILINPIRLETMMQFGAYDWKSGRINITPEEINKAFQADLNQQIFEILLNGHTESNTMGLGTLPSTPLLNQTVTTSKELLTLAETMRGLAFDNGAYETGVLNDGFQFIVPSKYRTLLEGRIQDANTSIPVKEELSRKSITPILLKETNDFFIWQDRGAEPNFFFEFDDEIVILEGQDIDFYKIAGNIEFSGLICGNPKELIKATAKA